MNEVFTFYYHRRKKERVRGEPHPLLRGKIIRIATLIDTLSELYACRIQASEQPAHL
jgi:hypothetical protein